MIVPIDAWRPLVERPLSVPSEYAPMLALLISSESIWSSQPLVETANVYHQRLETPLRRARGNSVLPSAFDQNVSDQETARENEPSRSDMLDHWDKSPDSASGQHRDRRDGCHRHASE